MITQPVLPLLAPKVQVFKCLRLGGEQLCIASIAGGNRLEMGGRDEPAARSALSPVQPRCAGLAFTTAFISFPESFS